MSDLNIQLRNTPIAIVGLGAVMPQAHNVREFWDNIVRKVDCITDVPESRWKIDDYYDPDPSAPDKTYCKRGGFIPDIDFDPMEFGLPPNILEVTDVSQMLSLVVAKEALADAGYLQAADELRDRTGVILGVGGGQKLITPLTARLQYPVWDEVLKSYGIDDENRAGIIERMKLAYIRWEENSFPGMLGNVVSGRIANRFDLGGTNCVVDAACASTMAALKMALGELTDHRADMMLTGGVDTDNSIFMFMCFSKTPAFSRGTHPRPFDAESDGMMVGEGIGMMVLKRLEDAERDGDRIYAVIKGLGSSSDGRFKSIYAPRGEGQERALRRAYEDAGFSPATVGLVEAHGTGTVAGDTTEVTTIVRYFNQHDTERQHIALGSVKSQIGHTKASAGAAGLIKTALALHHKILPPTLNVVEPNPKFDLKNSAFYVNSEARPWISGSAPRRAGVSSFGFGGTNFHVVLEEYTPEHRNPYRMHKAAQAVILSASTPQDLQAQIAHMIQQLQSDERDQQFLNLVRATRATAVPASAARIGFVAAAPEDAVSMLQLAQTMLTNKPDAEELQHPKGVFYRKQSLNVQGTVVALFAGQGSQYLEMGRELAINFPEVRDSFAQLDALLQRDGKPTLSSVVYPQPAFSDEEKRAQEAMLQGTDYAQPAIGALSAGMYRLLQAAGFRADFAAGHSFGEVSALWAAGVISDEDYYSLVKARGAAMAPPADNPNFDAGTMMAVTGDVAAIEREVASLPGIQIANHNSRTQVVVAGSKDAISRAETALKAAGFKAIPLSVSAAFHTPLVGHAQKPFAEAIQRARFNAPSLPVFSNATAQPYPADPAMIQNILSQHILQPVRFRDEIEQIYAAGGRVFVEFGPRNVLTNLVKDILGDRPHVVVSLNSSRQKDSDLQLREAVIQLQVLGLSLNGLDPYAVEVETTAPKKKGLNVKLNAASYVSDKTRATYRDALAQGSPALTITPAVTPAQVTPLTTVVSEAPAAAAPVAAVEAAPSVTTPEVHAEYEMTDTAQHVETALAEFRDHQRQTLQIHEQFGQSQSEYFRIFAELMSQQQSLLASQSLPANVAEGLTQNMLRFHEYQTETLRLHERYMEQQSALAHSLLELIRQQSGGSVSAPVKRANGYQATPAPAAAAPVHRVTEAHPEPVTVSAAPTPAVTVAGVPAPAPLPPVPAPQVVPPAPAPVAAAPTGEAVNALSGAMLRIVSEKTGYPSDMLELSMDMEADLGIDSIKRVEILGAMREEFPNLPQFSPEELGELRTLEQIVDYMRSRSGSAVVNTPAPTPAPIAVTPAASVAVTATSAPAVAAPTVPASSANGAELAALSEAMLRIVSDKTGYPAEMLELSMDMEADLGIDSIKRVEILGAMREEFPNLPQFSPEELGELRTLHQIVDYMRSRSGGTAVNGNGSSAAAVAPAVPAPVAPAPIPEAPAPASNGASLAVLAEAMLRIVSDKTGYPAEMLELSMDMEADLGIDSIKRVEILGAMREEFPTMPQFSPEELGELRTLQQIVDYMEEVSRQTTAAPFEVSAGSAPAPNSAAAPAPETTLAPIDMQGIMRSVVEVRRLPQPDYLEINVQGAVCLISDDGTPVTRLLAHELAERGWKPVILSLPADMLPANPSLNGAARVQLPDVSETSLQNALATIDQQHGSIGAFIYLNSPVTDTLFAAEDKIRVKFAFLMAKHLKPYLSRSGGTARRAFVAVTRLDGMLGTNADVEYGAIAGGLFGLIKTLSLEWNTVFCRAIDIAPQTADALIAEHILSELHDPNRLLTEVAYGALGRVTLITRQDAPQGANA